jgi:hypothetical protein
MAEYAAPFRPTALIWVKAEQKYFCKWGWTGFTDLPRRAERVLLDDRAVHQVDQQSLRLFGSALT